MLGWKSSASAGFLAVLVLALAVGGGMAQSAESAQPEWSDDVFTQLEDAVSKYNAQGRSDTGFLARELLRNARINLYVSDEAGAQAVYSLRVDDQLRVTELQHGAFDDPTIRAETTKATVGQIADADDTEAAVRRAVRNRRIHLERVVDLFAGVRLRIGIGDVLVGAGSIAIVSLVGVKIGFSPILSFLHDVVYGVFNVLQQVWNYLSSIGPGIATLLTILEHLDLLGPLKELVGRLWETLRDVVAAVLSQLDVSSTETEREEEKQR